MQLRTVELVFLIDLHIFQQSYIHAHTRARTRTRFLFTLSHTHLPLLSCTSLAPDWCCVDRHTGACSDRLPHPETGELLSSPAMSRPSSTDPRPPSLAHSLSSSYQSLSLFPMISLVRFLLHASLFEFASCTLPLLSVFISLSHRTVSAVAVTQTLPVHKHRCYNKWLQHITVTFEGFL